MARPRATPWPTARPTVPCPGKTPRPSWDSDMATGPRYRVEIDRTALKQLSALPREDQERIAAHVNALADDPRPHGVEKLKGFVDQYRIRVGSYRVIYTIRDDRLIVLVLRIGHRRDVYRRKKK